LNLLHVFDTQSLSGISKKNTIISVIENDGIHGLTSSSTVLYHPMMRGSGGDTELGEYAPVSKDEELGDNEAKDIDEEEIDLDNNISAKNIKNGASTFAEKRLLRKIDRRIMPCLVLMIILNYLDRNALANARVQGIEKSLGLAGSQFNTAGKLQVDNNNYAYPS
jgi:hypothetical protein